ncbi:MAG: universal stress protein [Pseudomonadota bacterium]|uniref:universal stress protein n=1 Tax=Herminiimonas arsenitoxidans TaxID=1809410 RepID=UPI00097041BE|nr:universal stress protein [Herminiimonas arsenitoxidans]
MFQKILIPTDGSPLSDKAVDTAIEFVQKLGGELVILSVAEPYLYTGMMEGAGVFPIDPVLYDDKVAALAQKHLDKIEATTRAKGIKSRTVVSIGLNPYEEIVKIAEEYKCDAIFMASHGRKGLNKLFVGSETQKVLAHTTLPVLVLR